MLNRHGLVAGATGTGKTKTLQLLAEQLSANGVPVFAADIKGDLSGLSAPGEAERQDRPRAPQSVGQEWTATGFPVEFYALGGQGTGIPLRVTMSAFGPMLLSKVLGLNDTQESSLGLVFHYADKAGPAAARPRRPARGRRSYLTSDEGKADLKDARRPVAGDRRRDPARADRVPGPGRRRVLRRAGVRVAATCCRPRPTARACISLRRAAQPAGPAGALLDVPDVAARRPLPRPARGGRRRQAEAGVLLRRGAPALQRRLRGVPRPDRPDRAADPVQGRRRLLRDPEPDRRPRRRAGPARLPGPAPAARAHAQRRQGAQGDRQHLPHSARTTTSAR